MTMTWIQTKCLNRIHLYAGQQAVPSSMVEALAQEVKISAAEIKPNSCKEDLSKAMADRERESRESMQSEWLNDEWMLIDWLILMAYQLI